MVIKTNGLIEQWYRLSTKDWYNSPVINFNVVHTQNPIPTCLGFRSSGETATDNIIIRNITTSSITIDWHAHGSGYDVFLKTIGY